jgi:Acetoacetate decarboxylase (ADC)
MLQGTADLDAVAERAPYVAAPSADALSIPRAELLQVAWELSATDRDALFPPALHPVNPPVVTFSFLRARECTHGPFTLAETRLLCRSGIRTRGYHVRAFVDNAEVATILRTGWGYRVTVADVTMSQRYDGATGQVAVDGVVVLLAGHVSPTALSPSDLQYTATMHPARLDRGLRLLQVERGFEFAGAERGDPFVDAFEAPAWGEPRLRLAHPVSASSAVANVAIKPIRFVCRADVWAFDGTEALLPTPTVATRR